jgi:hypothetical protein
MSISILSAEELLMTGWSPEAIVRQTMALDHETFGPMPPQVEGTHNQWVRLTQEHPQTVFVLLESQTRIVGYWHFVALRKVEFELAKQGKLAVDDLTAERVARLAPGVFPIYFVAITTSSSLRNHNSLRLLFDSIFQRFERLALQGVYFNEMCASAYTGEGDRLCRRFDMSPIYKGSGGTIYFRQLLPFPRSRIVSRHPLLVRLYNQRLGAPSAL